MQTELKHSGIGIAAFVLSLFCGVSGFVGLAVIGFMQQATPDGLDADSPLAIVLGLAMIGLLLIDIVALVLGVSALFQKDRKKIFAVLGIIFAGVVILGIIALLLTDNGG